jgi:TetR/AcrR family transcriptional repressor of nem operon
MAGILLNYDRHLIDNMTMIIYHVKDFVPKEDRMRVSREQAAKNREHVVGTAARLFREQGYDGIGVADLMKEAGLTHGGFYGNFASKEQLMAEACQRAFSDAAERWGKVAAREGASAMEKISQSYLSKQHVDHPGAGCAVAALGADAARLSPPVRAAMTSGIEAQIDLITGLQGGDRAKAIAAYAAMVGALLLARTVDDAALSEEILKTARDSLAP